VTSECLRRRAVDFGADPTRTYVLHNGISVEQWVEQWHKEGTGHPDGSAGVRHAPSALLYTRFAGVRPADVVALWAAVQVRVPEATLTVVGRGLGGEERELVGAPGIIVQGWVEPTELPGLFDRMSVAMAPWADTPPNRARHSAKVLELMAAGLPIVAHAVGELPATIGEAGVLVPPGDADAFAAAMADLMADPVRAERLGSAARARVQVDFTWEHLADAALAAYHAAGAV
jgi:glycosyltransferase involved in cell wall biosynthesis